MSDPVTTSPVALTIPDTAKQLSCSVMHVYRLIRHGELPTIDIRAPGSTKSKMRVRQEDLDAYLSRR